MAWSGRVCFVVLDFTNGYVSGQLCGVIQRYRGRQSIQAYSVKRLGAGAGAAAIDYCDT